MYGAWDALPQPLRERATRLRVKHDGTYNSGGFVRAGVTPSDDPRTAPGTLHPLVCVHPETGRRHLYLGRRRNAWLEGLPLDAAEGTARCDLGDRHGRSADVAPSLARRRPGPVGQPLRHAPPRRVRPRHAARDAPHPDQGRDTAVGAGASESRQSRDVLSGRHAGCRGQCHPDAGLRHVPNREVAGRIRNDRRRPFADQHERQVTR